MKKTIMKLHENQARVFHDEHIYRVLVAGRKFGKSTLALAELLRAVKTKKNVAYIAPTYKMARNTLWLDHISKFVPSNMYEDKHETDLRLTFSEGHMITLYGADNPDRLRGLNLDFVVLDECADIKPSTWEQVIEPNLLATKGRALFIGTPKGKNNQLYTLYNADDSSYESWQFTSFDNPYNDVSRLYATRARLMQNGRENWWRQEYLAEFTTLAGIIYEDWRRGAHVTEPEIEDCVYALSVDRGMYSPSSVGFYKIYRREGEDRLHRYDEIYQTGVSPNELVAMIRNKIGKRDFVYQYADPSAADFIATANEQGLSIEKANKETGGGKINWVREGISKCKWWLAKSPLDGKPRFTVSPKCKNFIEEIESYVWEEAPEKEDREYRDRPRKLNDHAMDEWRYLIVSYQSSGPDDMKELNSDISKRNWSFN